MHALPAALSNSVFFFFCCKIYVDCFKKFEKSWTKGVIVGWIRYNILKKRKENSCRTYSVLFFHFKFFLTFLSTILLCTAGEAEKPCILSLVDDTLYEEGEELRLVLGSPKSTSQFGASVGALNETLVKIKDTADSTWEGVCGGKTTNKDILWRLHIISHSVFFYHIFHHQKDSNNCVLFP